MFWADSWLFLRRNSFDRFYGFVWLRRFSYPRRPFKKLVQVLILIGIVFRHLFVDKPQIELPLSGMLNYRKRFAVRDFGQFNPLLGLLGLGRLLFIMHLIIISVYLVDWNLWKIIWERVSWETRCTVDYSTSLSNPVPPDRPMSSYFATFTPPPISH